MKKAISYFFSGALLVATVAVSSCSKDSAEPVVPPINGYTNSDSVSPNNLVAKWSFENSVTEVRTNNIGTATGVTFASGKKGQAWQGSSSTPAYAVYAVPSSLGAALTSYSIAFWLNTDSMKLPQAAPTQGYGAQGLFTIANAAGFWGGVNLFIENRSDADGDTLRLKLLTHNERAGVVWQDQGPIVRIPGKLNTWVHIALTYDGGTGRFTSYVDGAKQGKLEVPYGPVSGGTYIQYANDPGDINNVNGAAIQGVIQLPASTAVALGTHQFTTTPPLNAGGTQQPWATTFAGKMDEFRVYKTALSETEVSSIFQLESDGR